MPNAKPKYTPSTHGDKVLLGMPEDTSQEFRAMAEKIGSGYSFGEVVDIGADSDYEPEMVVVFRRVNAVDIVVDGEAYRVVRNDDIICEIIEDARNDIV